MDPLESGSAEISGMKAARFLVIFLVTFCGSRMDTPREQAVNKASCESCPVPGVDFKSTIALKAATKFIGV
jgi:hypothetical protein